MAVVRPRSEQEQHPSFFGGWSGLLFRFVLVYCLISYFSTGVNFGGEKREEETEREWDTEKEREKGEENQIEGGKRESLSLKGKGRKGEREREREKKKRFGFGNIIKMGSFVVLRGFVSEEELFEENDPTFSFYHSFSTNLIYGEEFSQMETFTIPTSLSLQNNGSLFLHLFCDLSSSLSPSSSSSFPSVFYYKHRLNVFQQVEEEDKEKKFLLMGEEEREEEGEGEREEDCFEKEKEISEERFESSQEISENREEKREENGEENGEEKEKYFSFWATNISVHLITETRRLSPSLIPPSLSNFVSFSKEEREEREREEERVYFPIVFFNRFWNLPEHFSMVNESTKELELNLEISSMSFFLFQFYNQFEESLLQQTQAMGSSPKELSNLKRMLLETNPFLLGTTFFVTLLHTIFDFLAFKNDISFWKNRKSVEGLSTRSVLLRSFCGFIIFLYLMDNETSWMIICSSGIGVLIDLWKITKVFDVSTTTSFPYIQLKDKKSYVSKTKEYDEYAMRYLSYVLYPLIVCYAIYSLVYQTHKSWYSWILSTLTGCVYTFGFIMMTPQIFINYKLKSVAHLPWRQLTYKFLNTIIDDLFAFIITMPILHRLACFRDDLIFLICLYQRWIYPVDEKRLNEYGSRADQTEEIEENEGGVEREEREREGGDEESEREGVERKREEKEKERKKGKKTDQNSERLKKE